MGSEAEQEREKLAESIQAYSYCRAHASRLEVSVKKKSYLPALECATTFMFNKMYLP